MRAYVRNGIITRIEQPYDVSSYADLDGNKATFLNTTMNKAFRIVARDDSRDKVWAYSDGDTVKKLYRGVASNDGKGILFISHLGEVYPSGFLPISAGNVRRDSVVEIYRHSDMCKSLRDPGELKGKCGECPFNVICGDCRARAYGVTDDPYAAELFCVFQPAAA